MDISKGMLNADQIADILVGQYDHSLPLPDIECQPHLLISKVRKQYMEYLIKLLAVNYETNQKLLNKNIYLPSAIWRCAKNIETAAAQMCMVVQLYRQNIVAVVKELKNDTKKGKLNRKLYECLHTPPVNEKKLQTTLNLSEDCNCECRCKYKKKRRKTSQSPDSSQVSKGFLKPDKRDLPVITLERNKIPVLINSQVEEPLVDTQNISDSFPIKEHPVQNCTLPDSVAKPAANMSLETQESDDLMVQLEKLFQADPNDDDLFDGYSFSNNVEKYSNDEMLKKSEPVDFLTPAGVEHVESSIIENHSIQIKSLDERLASLAGMLATNTECNSTPAKPETSTKTKKPMTNKWICEEFFLKSRLFELLDEIGDSNRLKLIRVKETLVQLFGDDSDDEGVASPLEETAEFVTSCKERIAPWVVKILTPYYLKGRIRGKSLFKALAKHLIRVIYQCSHYPREYEVKSFVVDFLESHKLIRCEADFKEFRIENL